MVPTTQPSGTEIAAVDNLWDATFLFSFGLTDHIEVDAALPITLGRTGTGVSMLTSQTPVTLSHATMRDARLGATFSLAPRARDFPGSDFGVVSRFERALPTGDETSFAGDRAVVGIPSFAADYRFGAFMAASELGAPSPFRPSRQPPRPQSSCIRHRSPAPRLRRLSLHLEAMALPAMIDSKSSTSISAAAGASPPAPGRRWYPPMASLDSLSRADGWRLSASLGFGTAIGFGDSAITTPNARVIFAIRYAPSAAARRRGP
jgi:hypothetical protein